MLILYPLKSILVASRGAVQYTITIVQSRTNVAIDFAEATVSSGL